MEPRYSINRICMLYLTEQYATKEDYILAKATDFCLEHFFLVVYVQLSALTFDLFFLSMIADCNIQSANTCTLSEYA